MFKPFKKIGDEDNRKIVRNRNKTPYQAICRLKLETPAFDYEATGFLIHPGLILTAGHNIYNSKKFGGYAQKGQFKFHNDTQPTRFYLEDCFIFEEWEYLELEGYDLAAIHINPRFDIEPLKIRSPKPEKILFSRAKVSGYDPKRSPRLLEHDGSITSTTSEEVFYNIDTDPAQSGSPILIGKTAIGVHCYGWHSNKSGPRRRNNYGPLFTNYKIQSLKEEMAYFQSNQQS